MTTAQFGDVVQKGGIVLVDFWAAWCGPCRSFAPIYDAAAGRHPGVVFAKVDTEAEPELAGALQIRAIPTLMAFRDGVLLFRHSGMLPGEALDDLVKKLEEVDMAEVHEAIAAKRASGDADDDDSDDDDVARARPSAEGKRDGA